VVTGTYFISSDWKFASFMSQQW